MRRDRSGWLGLVLSTVFVLAAGGCTNPPNGAASILSPGVKGCDVLLTAPAGHHCLLPWPNNAFTIPSTKTMTGRQLAVSSTLDPTNVRGVHASTTYVNQSDGFSPGSVIMTYVPRLDLGASHIASSTDIGSSLDSNTPIVLFDTATGQRVPYFAELDAQTKNSSRAVATDPPCGSRSPRPIAMWSSFAISSTTRATPSRRRRRRTRRGTRHQRARPGCSTSRRSSIPTSLSVHRLDRAIHGLGLHGREPEEPLCTSTHDAHPRL